jgi:imidazolonepropionase-like amidohydrolase
VPAHGLIRGSSTVVAWTDKQQWKPVLVGGRDIGLAAEQLAQKKIPVMLSGILGGPAHARQDYDEGYQAALRLHEAGVLFCIVGDEGPAYAWRLAHHATTAVASALPAEEGLKAITVHAAQILGIADVLGTLESGKDATLVVSDGHPLELWTRTERVSIRGRSIDMTDKHKRLYEHYLKKHRQREAARAKRSGPS